MSEGGPLAESASIHLESSVHIGQEPTVIPRYTRPEMARIWSDENRFRTWLAVEVAATEILAEAGIVPKEAAKAIHARADFSIARSFQIEAEVKHDVIAF